MKTTPNWIKDIKILVWDIDGTLYHENSKVKQAIYQNIIQLIIKTKGMDKKQAESLFYKLYRPTNSSTKVLLKLGVSPDYILSGKWYTSAQIKYLKSDLRLIHMLSQLKNYRQIVCTNSQINSAINKLNIIGIKPDYFEKIFTNQDFGIRVKPDLYAFKLILKYTQLPADEHLFIGDNEIKEIIPAKKLGMRTCLVWGKSIKADISLPSVYDVVKLFH